MEPECFGPDGTRLQKNPFYELVAQLPPPKVIKRRREDGGLNPFGAGWVLDNQLKPHRAHGIPQDSYLGYSYDGAAAAFYDAERAKPLDISVHPFGLNPYAVSRSENSITRVVNGIIETASLDTGVIRKSESIYSGSEWRPGKGRDMFYFGGQPRIFQSVSWLPFSRHFAAN